MENHCSTLKIKIVPASLFGDFLKLIRSFMLEGGEGACHGKLSFTSHVLGGEGACHGKLAFTSHIVQLLLH